MIEILIVFILMVLIMFAIYLAYESHVRWLKAQKFAEFHLALMSETKDIMLDNTKKLEEYREIRMSFQKNKNDTLICGKQPGKICDLCGHNDCLFKVRDYVEEE